MITVFTPTYNRKNLLRRCYNSLQEQTDNCFEWLIVDDGSTDGTKEYVGTLMKKSVFPIKYFYQKNGGKHTAFNRAVQECKTDYLLILDSDDMLTKDAIEVLNNKCEIIKDSDDVCGIIGNRGHINDDGVVGSRIPNVRFTSGLELYQKMNFHGDTMRLYKTSVLKKYSFPEIKGETFMPENVIFDKIDRKYEMLAITEIVYLSEYQEVGLSNNINRIRLENPIGYSLSLKSTAETALTLKKKVGTTILYIMWCKRFHISGGFNRFENKILYIICIPVSYIMHKLHRPRFFFDSN